MVLLFIGDRFANQFMRAQMLCFIARLNHPGIRLHCRRLLDRGFSLALFVLEHLVSKALVLSVKPGIVNPTGCHLFGFNLGCKLGSRASFMD